jgi:hypothetical protein
MLTDRFPSHPAVPAAPTAPRRLARPRSWLAAASRSLVALARRLRAALPGGRPLTDDNRLTGLWLTLDWLLDWQSDAGDHFTVPYQPPAAGPAVAPAPPIDLPAMPPRGAAAPPPDGAPPAPRARTNGVESPSPAADRSAPAEPTPAPSDAPPASALSGDGLAWPEPDAPEE